MNMMTTGLPQGFTLLNTAETPIGRILARYDRAHLEAFIAVAVDLLDAVDGDSDLELNGDETDHTNAEDEGSDAVESGMPMPGCPLSDPGGCEHDGREPEHEDIDEREADEAEADAPELSRPPEGARKSLEAHRARIREDRCYTRYGYDRYSGRRYVRERFLYAEPKVPTLRSLRRRHPALRGKRALRR